MCSVDDNADNWWPASVFIVSSYHWLWSPWSKIRPTRRMGQASRRPGNSWSLNKWEPLLKYCCLYKEPVKTLALKDQIQSATKKDYSTNTYQAIYSDILLISKIRWVSVQLHATPLWSCCQLSAYIVLENPDDLRPILAISSILISSPCYPVFTARQVGAIESSTPTSVGTMRVIVMCIISSLYGRGSDSLIISAANYCTNRDCIYTFWNVGFPSSSVFYDVPFLSPFPWRASHLLLPYLSWLGCAPVRVWQLRTDCPHLALWLPYKLSWGRWRGAGG